MCADVGVGGVGGGRGGGGGLAHMTLKTRCKAWNEKVPLSTDCSFCSSGAGLVTVSVLSLVSAGAKGQRTGVRLPRRGD